MSTVELGMVQIAAVGALALVGTGVLIGLAGVAIADRIRRRPA